MSHKNHAHPSSSLNQPAASKEVKLDLVLKCDATGCKEAVEAAIEAKTPKGLSIHFFSSGIGPVTKSDVFMAESASRLVVGFNVPVVPKLEPVLAQCGVEIRLYEVIYHLVEDLIAMAKSLIPPPPASETILGRGKVIALFKGSRKGVILGCQIDEGQFKVGQNFRVISAMGPVYTGKIASMHIENDVIQSAHAGQQIGIKIDNFKKAKINDLVEVFASPKEIPFHPWQPNPQILKI